MITFAKVRLPPWMSTKDVRECVVFWLLLLLHYFHFIYLFFLLLCSSPSKLTTWVQHWILMFLHIELPILSFERLRLFHVHNMWPQRGTGHHSRTQPPIAFRLAHTDQIHTTHSRKISEIETDTSTAEEHTTRKRSGRRKRNARYNIISNEFELNKCTLSRYGSDRIEWSGIKTKIHWVLWSNFYEYFFRSLFVVRCAAFSNV